MSSSQIELVLMSADGAQYHSLVVAADADYAELVQQVASVVDIPVQRIKLSANGAVLTPSGAPVSSFLTSDDVLTYDTLSDAEFAQRLSAATATAAAAAGGAAGGAAGHQNMQEFNDTLMQLSPTARNAALARLSSSSFRSLAELPPALLESPEHFYRIVSASPSLISQLADRNQELAQLLRTAPKDEAVAALRERFLTDSVERAEVRDARHTLETDPTDPGALAVVARDARQRTVDENYLLAMEHSPEVFATVTMLYVPIEVNKVPLKAFVDSGAQMTIMSAACVRRCGLEDLLVRHAYLTIIILYIL